MNNTEEDVLPPSSVNLLIVARCFTPVVEQMTFEGNQTSTKTWHYPRLICLGWSSTAHSKFISHQLKILGDCNEKNQHLRVPTNMVSACCHDDTFARSEATSKPAQPFPRYKPHSIIATTSYEKMVEVGLQTPSWVAWWCALESGTFASGLRDTARMPGWVYLTFMMNAFINPYAWSPRGIHFWRGYGRSAAMNRLRWTVGTEMYHSRWFVQPVPVQLYQFIFLNTRVK